MQAESSFFTFHISNVIEIGVVILAYLGYRRESKKDTNDRTVVLQNQAILHNENKLKLDSILEFNRSQAEVNRQRDLQINLLSIQTTQLATLATGFERRLTMLEDKNNN